MGNPQQDDKGRFITGNIGGGRPKGSRNKLGEAFIEAFQADFAQYGEAVIAIVRTEKPDQYLKVIASILPKELHVTDETLEGMSDDELIEFLAAVRAAKAGLRGKAARKPDKATPGQSAPGGQLN